MSRILIVDDSLFIRASIKNILAQEGHDVVGMGENGEEAVKIYKDVSPDMVLMDITMPVKNGLEALKEIRRFDSSAHVLMVSAIGMESVVVEAMASGAKGFIVKPFSNDALIQAVGKLGARG